MSDTKSAPPPAPSSVTAAQPVSLLAFVTPDSWITGPPIRPVAHQPEFRLLVFQLSEGARKADSAKGQAVLGILSEMHWENNAYATYFFNGKCVALMKFDTGGDMPDIEQIVTAADERDRAGPLIEWLLKFAKAAKVKLFPSTKAGSKQRESYARIGFADADGGWMVLDPSKSNCWFQSKAGWQYFGPPPPPPAD